MRDHVERQRPEEACGLLVGLRSGCELKTETVIPLTNVLHSQVKFRVEPKTQLAALNQIEATGKELVGIYHSHPHGPSTPSVTDISEHYDREVCAVIWNRIDGDWKCRTFYIFDPSFQEVSLTIVNNDKLVSQES